MPFAPCILIPVYNHEHAIGRVVEQILTTCDAPVLLVDDGSHSACHAVLVKLEAGHEKVTLLTLPENRGKGGAVKAGFEKADAMGFSHALQVDADGQHALEDIGKFLSLAEVQPDALICGCPIYDESVPKVRYYSRYLTHVWVWINTLSFDIKDSMCGFRVYPVGPIAALVRSAYIGNRMDFDSEIIVRWHWLGHKVINVPTEVSYPMDGVSHFQGVKDNVLISGMHARLCLGMLLRLPLILGRRLVRKIKG